VTLVRDADVADAAGMARVHVRAWQAAYRNGLMPDEYLESLSIDERTTMWTESLERSLGPRRARLVGVDDTGAVTGFILVGPAEGDDTATDGQLFVINVDRDHWGTGAGPVLHDAGVQHLRDFGFDRAVLWVHPENERARRFYETRGWRCDDIERREEIMGVEVPEVRYSIELG
jgi:RimJ/RimL family protein N-acetyltransferase